MTTVIRSSIKTVALFVLVFVCLTRFDTAYITASELSATVIRVIDGDTIEVHIDGRRETVRFIGMDTPETVHPNKSIQPWGPEASAFTKQVLPTSQAVSLELDVQQRDRYGRILAYVYLPDGRMVNAILLEAGLAQLLTIPPNVNHVDTFIRLQREAREAGRGMWKSLQLPVPAIETTISLMVDLKAETATIVNFGEVDVDITGWKLVSLEGGQEYTLPQVVLSPNTQITVTSGPKAKEGPGYLKWTKSYVWNDKGDPARLYDTSRHLIAFSD